MMGQDNDRMGQNLYSKLFVCLNDECEAVYEYYTDEKGRPLPGRHRWFNPHTGEFES